jgi:glycosyltransferase involved in cell wall biosynthesis
MSLLSRIFKSAPEAKKILTGKTFLPVIKQQAHDSGPYAEWIKNHLWNSKNEKWCRDQIPKFKSQPTIGILMQSTNPRIEFLRESFSSIFNQVYPFHRLYVVDRGSQDNEVRKLIEEVEKDSRVKVSFQKGAERDTEAIARIMKKADSEWLFLMGAEDVIEPYALYYMAAYLQDQVEIDFVFGDSDLIDNNGLRFAPQFKPVWAVGASYPLGYYQHPLLMSARIVEKLKGHERVVSLMEEGSLLDEASNHSRYVVQVPGILYHARERGLKNEIPPEPVNNVLMSESLVKKGDEITIDTESRIAAEPPVPLKILWILDSLDLEDAPSFLLHLARYLRNQSKHELTIVSSRDGILRRHYENLGKVTVVKNDSDLPEKIKSLHQEQSFDVAFISAQQLPTVFREINLPVVWQLHEQTSSVPEELPATALLPSESKMTEKRSTLRVLPAAADLAEIKLFKQTHSPIDLRANYGIKRTASVITIVGPTIERKGQKIFVDAALELLKRHPQIELQFFIVGCREGTYLQEIKNKIQNSPHADHFHLVKEEESPAASYPYFWISDVCVSCSTEETFPIAVLEAMAFKKAVVGTGVYRINEIIQDGGNGFLVNPNDPIDLADKLESIALDRDYAEALGREGLELAMEKFALKKIATRFERYLRESIVL